MTESSAPLLDYIASAKGREDGVQSVTTNNREWLRLALIQIEQLALGKHEWSNLESGFIGEDLRAMLVPQIGRPSTPHCYGAMVRMALQRELIEETGKLRAMKDVNSHARRSMVYRWRVVK
jgi:hypothetical protein